MACPTFSLAASLHSRGTTFAIFWRRASGVNLGRPARLTWPPKVFVPKTG
jgi:hypothetical protein